MTAAENLQQRFDQNPKRFISEHMANVHMWEAHEQTSQVKMLNNVLKPGRVGGKFGDSQFRKAQNRDLGADCVQKLLEEKMPDILDYVDAYKKDPTAVPDSQLFHIEMMMQKPDGTKTPDYIGFGFKQIGASGNRRNGEIARVDAVKTNTVACIIRPTRDNPDGWEITSAFPMVAPREDQITPQTAIDKVDKDFSNILHNTFAYQGADPVAKAYMDATCSGKPLDSKYRMVYTPVDDRHKTPTVMFGYDRKRHPDAPEYPRVMFYANQNPPANATLFTGEGQRHRMGTPQADELLSKADPELARIYQDFVNSMPDEFKPTGQAFNRYRAPETTAAPAPAQAAPAPARQAAAPAARRSRLDPAFESQADSIEQASSQSRQGGRESPDD